MKRLATLALLSLLAAPLASCGSDRGEDELMRRVAQADEAASKAEASAKRAEAAAARLGVGSSSDDSASPPPAKTVVEEGPAADPDYGKGTDPVPIDG